MLVILIGEGGCGKTTLVDRFCNVTNFSKLVTYTTRPMRHGETDDVDYHFITNAEFKEKIEKNEFIEYTRYKDWWYGTPKMNLEDNNKIVILTPRGARKFKEFYKNNDKNLLVVYLNVDRKTRLINMLQRGDSIEEAYRRNLSDIGMFDGVEDEFEAIIRNHGFTKNVDQLVCELMKCINEKRVGMNG